MNGLGWKRLSEKFWLLLSKLTNFILFLKTEMKFEMDFMNKK